MIYVPGCGPSTAKLAIIGEAPSGDEELAGMPFVGATGRMVEGILTELGTGWDAIYRTNVCKIRPPGNDIKRLRELGRSVEEFIPQLHEELDRLKPNAILALGETALKYLTNETGIKKWRGSILPSRTGLRKVISTIHPAAILHGESGEKMVSWKDLTYIKWDFARALAESKFPELDLPRRNLIVCRSSLDLFRFFDRYQGKPYVAVDIETFRTIPLCISFAFNRHEAISVPLFHIASPTNPDGIGRSDMLHIWKAVSEVLADPKIGKLGQNFKFDESLLKTCFNGTIPFGMLVRNFHFDTHLAFRTLYPELPASLQFITSVLTKENYYKDEGKDYHPKKDKFDRLLLYNAKDSVVTYECFEEELKELRERGLEDFFFTRVMPLHSFYSRVERRGILRDDNAKQALATKYKSQQEKLEAELLTLTEGVEINVNSNGPKGQVAKYLFGVLNLPFRTKTDEKTLDALMRNSVKDPTKRRIVELILEIRKVRKVRGTYIEAKPSADGRLRTAYRIMLETGRTSTSILKPPITTEQFGLAFQTITKHGDVGSDLRSEFIPTPGFVFLEPDLSQAEDRVVAVLSRDDNASLIYQYKIDRHRITAGGIYDSLPSELLERFFAGPSVELADEVSRILKAAIEDWQRQMGKKFRHAGNYDMGKRTAAENVGISEWRAGKLLEKFHLSNPKIRGVFHHEVEEALRLNERKLRNPFGRERQFLNRWGHELFKEAYAQLPQSTVSDQLKFSARRIEERAPWLRIVQESHDSFLSECPLGIGAQYPFKFIDRACEVMREELERPIDFRNCTLSREVELIIPCEIGIGTENWENMEKIA